MHYHIQQPIISDISMRITHPCRTLIRSLVSLPFSHSRLSPTFPASLLRYPYQINLPRTLVISMAETTEPLSAVAGESVGAVVDDTKFGFKREEMYKATLAGTVDAYDRHVFLCYKGPESWAPRVEASDTDLLPKLLASAVKARKDDITIKTKVTISGAGDGTEFSDGDVLIFPEMIKYRGLDESNVDSFVEDVLVGSKPWASGVQEVLTGSHVFVCAHGSRDKRCGVCGPVLMDNLKKEIEVRGWKDQVFVSPCSHIGGHKYAGNLIIYSPDPEGKITGHWYGYVTPDDVPGMLDQHIAKGEIIEPLWRGQMGGHVEEGKKEKEHKLPNGTDVKKNKKKHKESSKQETNESVASCCQGANGVSCCRDESSEQKSKSGVRSKMGLGKLSGWMKSWEQGDVLAAVAVVGAVATVAVAYSIYRRSN